MATRAKRVVEAALQEKGFRREEGDHHYFFYWTQEGLKSSVRTKTSHGSGKDLGDTLLALMAKQTKLAKMEFLNLVDCPMSREEYEKRLDALGLT